MGRGNLTLAWFGLVWFGLVCFVIGGLGVYIPGVSTAGMTFDQEK